MQSSFHFSTPSTLKLVASSPVINSAACPQSYRVLKTSTRFKDDRFVSRRLTDRNTGHLPIRPIGSLHTTHSILEGPARPRGSRDQVLAALPSLTKNDSGPNDAMKVRCPIHKRADTSPRSRSSSNLREVGLLHILTRLPVPSRSRLTTGSRLNTNLSHPRFRSYPIMDFRRRLPQPVRSFARGYSNHAAVRSQLVALSLDAIGPTFDELQCFLTQDHNTYV